MRVLELEQRIYEILGIKIFKRGLLFLDKVLTKDLKMVKGTYYHMDLKKGYQALQPQLKQIKNFAMIHIILILLSTMSLILVPFTSFIIFNICSIVFNSYSVMLQRYNNIRLNEVITRYNELLKNREEREKQKNKESFDNQTEVELNKIPIKCSISCFSPKDHFQEEIEAKEEENFIR